MHKNEVPKTFSNRDTSSKTMLEKCLVVDATDMVIASLPKLDCHYRKKVMTYGSMVNLSNKFGVMPEVALDLMRYAVRCGMNPIGFTFHIGSQCLRLDAWSQAIKMVGSIWKQAREMFRVDFINIGGGFPISY